MFVREITKLDLRPGKGPLFDRSKVFIRPLFLQPVGEISIGMETYNVRIVQGVRHCEESNHSLPLFYQWQIFIEIFSFLLRLSMHG